MGQTERLGVYVLVSVLSGPVAAQVKPTGAGIYSCVDSQGRRWTADRPIVECADREQRVLGPSGAERQRLAPRPTEEEAAARERQLRAQQLEAQRVQDARRRERALLMRYPQQTAHDAERQLALAPVEDGIAATRKRIDDVRRSRYKLEQEMEFYQRDPAKAPQSLRRAVVDNDLELAEQQRYMDSQVQERQRIQQRFDEELAVLQRLWGPLPVSHPAPAEAARTR